MRDALESYIASQNILNFKVKLQNETDPNKRKIRLLLLANEVASHPEAVQLADTIAAVQCAAENNS